MSNGGPCREMTLDEYVGVLPKCHLAARELASLRARLASQERLIHRLTHNEEIESDRICKHELDAVAAREERDTALARLAEWEGSAALLVTATSDDHLENITPNVLLTSVFRRINAPEGSLLAKAEQAQAEAEMALAIAEVRIAEAEERLANREKEWAEQCDRIVGWHNEAQAKLAEVEAQRDSYLREVEILTGARDALLKTVQLDRERERELTRERDEARAALAAEKTACAAVAAKRDKWQAEFEDCARLLRQERVYLAAVARERDGLVEHVMQQDAALAAAHRVLPCGHHHSVGDAYGTCVLCTSMQTASEQDAALAAAREREAVMKRTARCVLAWYGREDDIERRREAQERFPDAGAALDALAAALRRELEAR